ncbi:MAG: hypothetical protein ACE5K7_06125 [Phycisphaerae bacterium]
MSAKRLLVVTTALLMATTIRPATAQIDDSTQANPADTGMLANPSANVAGGALQQRRPGRLIQRATAAHTDFTNRAFSRSGPDISTAQTGDLTDLIGQADSALGEQKFFKTLAIRLLETFFNALNWALQQWLGGCGLTTTTQPAS